MKSSHNHQLRELVCMLDNFAVHQNNACRRPATKHMWGHLERWRKDELVVTHKAALHVEFLKSSQLTEKRQHPGAVSVEPAHNALQAFQCPQRWQHGQQVVRLTLASHQRGQFAQRRELGAGSRPCKQKHVVARLIHG